MYAAIAFSRRAPVPVARGPLGPGRGRRGRLTAGRLARLANTGGRTAFSKSQTVETRVVAARGRFATAAIRLLRVILGGQAIGRRRAAAALGARCSGKDGCIVIATRRLCANAAFVFVAVADATVFVQNSASPLPQQFSWAVFCSAAPGLMASSLASPAQDSSSGCEQQLLVVFSRTSDCRGGAGGPQQEQAMIARKPLVSVRAIEGFRR